MDSLASAGQGVCENICEPKSMGKCLCEGSNQGDVGTGDEPRTWEWTSNCVCGSGTKAKNCRCKFTLRCGCGGGDKSGGCCEGDKEIFTCACQCGSGTCEFRIRKCRCCQVIKTELGVDDAAGENADWASEGLVQ